MTAPPRHAGASLWHSAGVRLAALVGFLVLLTMLATLALVYVQVSTALHRNVERQLVQSKERLVRQYESAGAGATAQEITRLLRDGRNTDSELVLLTTPTGEFLAGNIDGERVPALPAGAAVQLAASPGGAPGRALWTSHRLEDGALLVVGQDLQELNAIESMVATASLIAGLFALSLALVSTLFFRRELARSIDAIHSTIVRISEGQLHERVPVQPHQPSDDEFTRLEQDFNHMLDRITQLMEGVRHVSDTIAHNLRTPLTRVRLRLQAAHDGKPDPAALQAALRAAMDDIEDLSRVLDKLLAIAQAESGTRRAPFDTTSWHAVAAEVVELYEDLAEHEGVSLVWEGGPQAPLLGDHSLLAGAVVNVVDNAIKYAGRGASVRIFTRQPTDEAACSELVVQDNGPGAPAGELATLGQRFVRLRPELPGHGLGLASVHAVMQLHGGSMRLEPAQPGLRVALSLPTHLG